MPDSLARASVIASGRNPLAFAASIRLLGPARAEGKARARAVSDAAGDAGVTGGTMTVSLR